MTITIKQFMDKYHVPYAIVYEATYRVKPVVNDIKAHEYVEQELYKEVESLLIKRIKRHKQQMDKLVESVRMMREVK